MGYRWAIGCVEGSRGESRDEGVRGKCCSAGTTSSRCSIRVFTRLHALPMLIPRAMRLHDITSRYDYTICGLCPSMPSCPCHDDERKRSLDYMANRARAGQWCGARGCCWLPRRAYRHKYSLLESPSSNDSGPPVDFQESKLELQVML